MGVELRHTCLRSLPAPVGDAGGGGGCDGVCVSALLLQHWSPQQWSLSGDGRPLPLLHYCSGGGGCDCPCDRV